MEAWGALQHRQHQRMFQMRAAETRLPVLTAAVSGPTFAAAPGGAVLKELPFHKTGTLLVSFAPSNRSTLFTLGGWLMGPLCTFAVCAALAFFVITRMVMPRMSNRRS